MTALPTVDQVGPSTNDSPDTDTLTRRRGFGWLAGVGVVGPVGVASAVVCALLALMAIFAPLLAPHDPDAVDVLHVFAGSSASHLLGTDDTGRDLLSRLIYGARTSLAGPLLVTVISAVCGTGLGLLCAWRRGILDSILSRVFDLLFAFPGIVLAIVASTIFGVGFVAPVLALSVSYLPVMARMMRSAALKERNLPYIEALHVQGASGLSISLRHVLPNIAPLLFVQATVGFGYALLDLATISFLGLGVQPPSPDWGVMVAEGKPSILGGQPQESLYAAAVIVIAVVAVNLVGEQLAQHFELGGRS